MRSQATHRVLLERLGDKKAKIRKSALRGIVQIKSIQGQASAKLIRLTYHSNSRIKRFAIRALGRLQLKKPSVLKRLKALYQHKVFLIRWDAHAALRRLGISLKRPSINGPYGVKKVPTSRPASSRPTSRPIAR